MREELISGALSTRFDELCRVRVPHIAPERFGEAAQFVSEALGNLLDASPEEVKKSSVSLNAPLEWMTSDADCFSSLRALCLGQQQELHKGQHPRLEPFLKSLDASRRDPARRFQLIAERYACPLNFSLPDEDEAREYVLMRLMVQERARLERGSVEAINADDLLLKLNLVAIHASLAPDLRFLDSLNYYYELLPAAWHPQSAQGWLLVSYYALYARALAARI
ncbi:MAG TPA: hypothetical protein VK619_07350 [Pyrinomonadaceae bacterium]|nr:hypothetical protein [Pyrinomonadaceae bacterium]